MPNPRRLASLAHELHHGRPRPPSGRDADVRPRDHSGRVLSALKVTIRLGGTATVRYFDTWTQLSKYLTGEDFTAIAPTVRSIAISHRPEPQNPRPPKR